MSYHTNNNRKYCLSPIFMAFLTVVPLTSQAALLNFSVATSQRTASGCNSNGILLDQQGNLTTIDAQPTCTNQGTTVDISTCAYTGLSMESNGNPILHSGQNCIQSKGIVVASTNLDLDLDFTSAKPKLVGCDATGIQLGRDGKVTVNGFNKCADKIQSSGGNNTLTFKSAKPSVNCTFNRLAMDANGKVSLIAGNSGCRKPDPTGVSSGVQILSRAAPTHELIALQDTKGYSSDVHIILTGVPTQNGNQAGVVQLTEDQGKIKARFKEWDHNKHQQHKLEQFDYALLEKGCHSIGNQGNFIVDSFELDMTGNNALLDGNWKSVTPPGNCSPSQSLTSVFMTIQPYEGAPLIVRAKKLTKNGFEAALFQDKALTTNNSQRNGSFTIGYIAFYGNPNGTITVGGNKVQVSIKTVSVNHTWKNLDGFIDPAQQIRLQEDDNADFDPDTQHKFEKVQVLNFDNKLFAQDIDFKGRQPFVLRRQSVQ